MSPQETVSLWRIVDANANRSTEGMRVVEEYARFVLEDQHLTRRQKQLRHDLTEVLRSLPRGQLAAARSTTEDVGTRVATQQEFQRRDARDVAAANQKRVEQSLRSMEEYLKPLAPEAAAKVEQIRYRAYTLGRALELTGGSSHPLEQARLYVLLDGRGSLDAFESTAAELARAGVHALQLRAPELDDRALLARGRALRELTRETHCLYIMNNRPDLAVLTHADGIHVGQDDLTVKEIRTIVGAKMLVGVSTHSVEQARQAVLDGANYLGCGPTFPSQTKAFSEFPGLELLQAVRGEISLPAFAIGGVTLENLAAVQATGFTRVAVAGAVASAPDPPAAARRFLEKLGRAAPPSRDDPPT